MASSGIYTYTYTRDQIINAALRKLAVLSEGTPANSVQLTTGAEALNLLTLQLQVLGMPLWARKTVVIPMIAGVSSYTLTAPRSIKVVQAYRNDTANPTNVSIEIRPDYDFNLLPETSRGIPVAISHQPLVPLSVIKVWPTPDITIPAGTTLSVVYYSELAIFNANTDTPDFPQEWYLTLVYQLAHILSTEYGIPVADQKSLEMQAEKHLKTVLDSGMEDGSLFVQPAQDY